MKKLNNKGYLLVEIIVASVLAIGVAYFLINLTIKFSSKDKDIYKSIVWTNDKNILTNLIMEDIKGDENKNIYFEKASQDESVLLEDKRTINFSFLVIEEDGVCYAEKTKKLKIYPNNKDEMTIQYLDFDGTTIIYEKIIDKSLIDEEENLFFSVQKIDTNNDENAEYTQVKLPLKSKYNDQNYGLNLFIKNPNITCIDLVYYKEKQDQY